MTEAPARGGGMAEIVSSTTGIPLSPTCCPISPTLPQTQLTKESTCEDDSFSPRWFEAVHGF